MKSCIARHFFDSFRIAFLIFLLIPGFLTAATRAESSPRAAWHRGDVSVAQENSRKAVLAALQSSNPNIEVDIIDFTDKEGNRVGLLVHDYEMDRVAGSKGDFKQYGNVSEVPRNSANPDLSPEPYMTVRELFELIRERKSDGVTPRVSLDMKEEGDTGEAFGEWIGRLIRDYGFQDHVFASSFFKSNVVGIEKTCPECMTGGLVFNDHFALKHLDFHHTSLDLTGFSKMTFFLGFPGKQEFNHDFVLIQDDIFFDHPELVDYWKSKRGAKFVGVFVYGKERPYTDEEWKKLEKVDWLEIDPPQMKQILKRENH